MEVTEPELGNSIQYRGMEALNVSGGGVLSPLRLAWSSATKGTVASSVFILLATCMGAGTLSLPYAFSQGGSVVFSVIFFLSMVSCAGAGIG